MLDFIPNPLVVPVGLAIGILIAAPVGPVNVLCIQRAVERGILGGLAAGLGAVLADGLIALAAALGVGAISGLVSDYRSTIQAIGGFALLIFGVRLIRKEPEPQFEAATEFSRASLIEVIWDLPKAFFLTLTNPAAVLGLFAIFGGISSFVEVRGKIDALTMVAAIMIGSSVWWAGLSFLIGSIRHAVDARWLDRINIGAGLLLIAFAFVLLGELVLKAPWAIDPNGWWDDLMKV